MGRKNQCGMRSAEYACRRAGIARLKEEEKIRMRTISIVLLILVLMSFFLILDLKAEEKSLLLPQEKRLKNIKQLTFGGKNAEAYFSFDGAKLIFQSTREGYSCDQIFIMNIDGSDVRRVSTGQGQTTCAYFFPGDRKILYSSTHPTGPDCPPVPPREKRFIWPLHPFEIFVANSDGSNLKRLTSTGDYNAEATVSKGGKIVFTSLREGDLDIYVMNQDGSGVKRLTDQKGYDGGPFFSADGKRIVYRAHHPKNSNDLKEYEAFLNKRQVVGGTLELFVMNSDGSNQRPITNNGASNFCPFFHPSGKQIIFSSNLHQPQGREFSLYLIHADGTGLERITFHPGFDSFPMFSPEGKKLVFVSNRNAKQPGEFNIFVADWIP
jgi:Tol biopolymer transport system component